MARIRSMHEAFAMDEELSALPDHVQLAHDRLPVHLDKAGRCEDRPAMLRAKVFPYRDVDMNAVLDALAGIGKLARYEVAGKRYIQWANFVELHHPHHKEADSKIPAPPASSGPTPLEHGASTVPAPTTTVEHPEPAPNQPLGVLSLVSGSGHGERESVIDGCLPALSPLSSTPKIEDQIKSFHEAFDPQYLEVTGCPHQRSDTADRKLADLFAQRQDVDRIVQVCIGAVKTAKAGADFPMNSTKLASILPHLDDIEARLIAGKQLPRLTANGEPERTWRDRCRERGHDPECGNPSLCEIYFQRAERQREIDATPGGEEAWREQRRAQFEAVHGRRNGKAVAS